MGELDVERRAIEASLRAEGWAAHSSLQRAIANWSSFSLEAAAYRWSIDDYTNEVCSRDYLELFLARATPPLRASVEREIERADAQFRELTVEDAEGLIARYFRVDDTDGWWWRRRPSAGSLADYLAKFA